MHWFLELALLAISHFFLLFGEEMCLPFDAALEPLESLSTDARLFLKESLKALKIQEKLQMKVKESIKLTTNFVTMQKQVFLTFC